MEKRYAVRNVRTGRCLSWEMYVGKMIVGWSLYSKPQSLTREQAQALSCVWILVSGETDLEIEEVEP